MANEEIEIIEGLFGTGDFDLDFSDPLSSRTISDAVLRVTFLPNTNPYLPFTFGAFSVQQNLAGTKAFLGAFETDFQETVVPLQIPLIGQSLEELADSISTMDGVRAEVLNGNEFVNSQSLLNSAFYIGTNRWAYFWISESSSSTDNTNIPHVFSLQKNIKFYLTSVEPSLSQNTPSQSLGGFISPTQTSGSDVLSESISFHDLSLKISEDTLSSYDLLQIQDEVLVVDSWDNNVASISERQAFDTPLRFHPKGSVVRGMRKNNIFDINFNNQRKQYRCIAIRNETSSEFAKDVKVFFNISSRNMLSNTKLAVEIPRSEYQVGSVDTGSSNFFTDNSLAGKFKDEHFIHSAVTFTSGLNSGQTRIISSYNGSEGTFSTETNLPHTLNSGDNFTIDTSPSQRIANGGVSPKLNIIDQAGTSAPFLISDFHSAHSYDEGVSININGQRPNGSILGPKESIYIWIERELSDLSEEFVNNRMIITLGYSRV